MKEIKEKNAVSSFKCEHCNKTFSSEEFLNSHIKRRHTAPTNPPLEVETDKLHLEIKELKGRLNSAEKMIQRDQIHLTPAHEKDAEYESKKIDELQQKFEDLRVQVQSELKILQTQHNFQEKYEKLFEKMTLQNSNIQIDKGGSGDLGKRRESTTQTDTDRSPQETAKQHLELPKSEVKNKENIPEFDNTQKQITEFGEALEIKVTSSLQKIETQMQSFWNKLSEMEVHKKDHDENERPPAVKPRSKYTVTSPCFQEEKENDIQEKSTSKKRVKKTQKEESSSPSKKLETKFVKEERRVHEEISNSKKKLSKKIQKEENPLQTVETKPGIKKLNVTSPKPVKKVGMIPIQRDSFSKSSYTETSSSESDTVSELPNKPPPRPVSAKKKRPQLNSTKKVVVDDELFEHFKEEVEKIVIMGRLQDLGVSPEWKGLPTRSFQRAIEIVQHQATLMKKTCPNFDVISAQIEKEVKKKVQDITFRNKGLKRFLGDTPSADERKRDSNVNKKSKVLSPHIEIKNRKMYETDSESEIKVEKVKENLTRFSEPYSAVIEELKSVTTKLEGSDKSVSDLSSIKDEEIVKNEDQTKGVLKNYPSVGSLTKKKVLFNLKNEDNEKAPTNKDGGSTTSIASSVFDGTPRQSKEKKFVKEKDIEDLSDFDFSDM